MNTKEHIIGELYIQNYELFRSRDSLIQENKKLESEIKTLEILLNSQKDKKDLSEVALGDESAS